MSSRTKIRLGALGLFILGLLLAAFDFPNRFPLLPRSAIRPYHFGLDLQGGVQLIYQADVSNLPAGEGADALNGVRDVIERRVNTFGVSEPVVQTAKSAQGWRVVVELPGVTDVNAAIALINETPRLEFQEVDLNATTTPALPPDDPNIRQQAEAVLALAQQPDADFAALAKEHSQDSSASDGGDLGWAKVGTYVPQFGEVCFSTGEVGSVYPELVKSPFGYHVIKVTERRGAAENLEARCSHILFLLPTPETPQIPWQGTELTGAHLERAGVTFDQQTGEPQVTLQFDAEGKRLFGEITQRNVGRPVGIFLDGQEISSPIVREAITTGDAVISGNFTIKEAKLLRERLNAGALPVPITMISQQSVGATLGKISVAKSLSAGIVGLALVILYLIAMYRWPGVLASLCLGLYGLLLLALFKLIPVTVTLAGIAGFVLTLGMAVDANILIFERLKEELRAGRTLGRAIEASYQRAWPSIRDSNISTLLTSLILMWFSTSFVKGFAVTLTLGIMVNLFTAIVASRVLVVWLQPRELPPRYLWLYGLNRRPAAKPDPR